MSVSMPRVPGESPVAAIATERAGKEARMENAAHQFEASLMQELFKPLQNDALFRGDGDGDGDGEGDGGGDAEGDGGGISGPLGSFAAEAMARAVSDRGGFGIARQLIEHFKKTERRAEGLDPMHSSSTSARR
jgi:Rod binding domain-containing protein